MKIASKVFVIIGLVLSIILLIWGFKHASENADILLSNTIFHIIGLLEKPIKLSSKFILGYSFYALATSIGCLIVLMGESKGKIIALGILYMPVILLASIFMLNIKEEDLMF